MSQFRLMNNMKRSFNRKKAWTIKLIPLRLAISVQDEISFPPEIFESVAAGNHSDSVGKT